MTDFFLWQMGKKKTKKKLGANNANDTQQRLAKYLKKNIKTTKGKAKTFIL